MSNAIIDKKNNKTKKLIRFTSVFFFVAISHRFRNNECVSHDLALSNSSLQSFQSIQESWHYYIDIIYFFGIFERQN